jgi:hypothetical protein
MGIRFISLGHRCHIGTILRLNKLRNDSLPFDSIIYSFEGVINCFENNFINFFPKQIQCEYIFVGKTHPEADINGNRMLFRGKYGSFTHHDLNNIDVIDTFKKRIQRLNEYLSANNEIIFIRTVMEDNEYELLDKFTNTIKSIYPNLKFKIFLVYDNKNIPEIFLKYNDNAYVVNSCMTITNQNDKTPSISYNYLLNNLKNINNLNDIKINCNFCESDIIFKNDNYKGYAIKNGTFPYDINN